MTSAGPPGDVADADSLDPAALGFMCGLEIHQQLATGKLHSRQPGALYDHTIDTIPDSWSRVQRRLRAAEGEAGEVDIAARFEQRRNRSFVYVQSPNAGLIELDESPPDDHDADAVDIALTVSAMMAMSPVPLLQAMRKTVVDGSNTSGFQRTTMIATGGAIETESGVVGLSLLCLEEDSARKLDVHTTRHGEQVVYNLDRLGIPLIEIATEPEVTSPAHAKETAIALGQVLRDTRRVRRGLGSIRQDLNVSIACGDRVEIKGCQDLDWIPRIISLEVARQLHLYRLASDLRAHLDLPPLPDDRRADDSETEARVAAAVADSLPLAPADVSDLFATTESEMVSNALGAGDVVLGVRLAALAGRLGAKELDASGAQLPRLGRELASAARAAGVRGIIHSDELPAHGITEEEMAAVCDRLGCSDADAFALCAAPEWQAELALEAVVHRARLAWHRIPQEVRNVVIKKGGPEDGTTTAMRPLPGGARMYPETDVPVLALTEEHWNQVSADLPPTSVERRERLAACDLSQNQVDSLLGAELDDEFHAGHAGELAAGLDALPAKAWAALLLDRVRDEVAELAGAPDPECVPLSLIGLALSARGAGDITRDGIVPLATELLTSGAWNESGGEIEAVHALLLEAAASAGFVPAQSGEVEAAVEKVLAERAEFVAENGMQAMGPLMGVVMAELGGGADGKVVSAVLKEHLERLS